MHDSRDSTKAFTLVEIMILVIIVGILATMALPYVNVAREMAQNTRLMNDWRIFASAFESYSTEAGDYPEDGASGEIPVGMEEHLRETAWSMTTAVGGSWNWDFEKFGIAAGISLVDSSVVAGQMRNLDEKWDDGDLANGLFRQTGATRFTYILDL